MKLGKKVLLLVVLLVASLLFNHFVITDLYNETSIFGAFPAKFERAKSIQEPKVILIGGSSTNLSFDSQLFETLSGQPTVNLSLTAAIPLRVYMNAVEQCANPGDTVILAMEYGYYSTDFFAVHETYADMVALDSSLKCQDGFWGNIEFAYTAFLRSYTRVSDCLVFALKDMMGVESSIYVADSINEYGDFVLHQGKTPTYKSAGKLNGFTWYPEVLENIRLFMDRMAQQDIRVLFTYPPIDKGHFTDYQQYCADVQRVTAQYFTPERCLGTPFDFLYTQDLFYDTAYHLQYENRAIYTSDLFAQLQKIP